jgi:nickel-dependent lactate racemase
VSAAAVAAPLVAAGGPDAVLDASALDAHARTLAGRIAASGARRVLLVPPDHTRRASHAGELTAALVRLLDPELEQVDVMPALGTHRALGPAEAELLFGDAIGVDRLLVHRWREDVVTLGELPPGEVDEVLGRPLGLSLPVTVNRLLVEGGYDLVAALGQVVPHEVAGFGGGVKHLVIGLGGGETIQRSHYVGAVHGIEETLGRADTPVRRLLDRGFDRFLEPRCRVLFAFTVVEGTQAGPVVRGLFAGEGGSTASGGAAFRAAVELARAVNVTALAEPVRRCVAWLDPSRYHSTWLGNKAIYRTRLALADGAELYVIAPGVDRFGEDATVDALIRRHGYRGREASLRAVETDTELAANLAAAAHLMHGSSEGRFEVVYCTGPGLSRREVEGVGFRWLPAEAAAERFADRGRDGLDGTSVLDVGDPALGLWTAGPRRAQHPRHGEPG